MITKETVFLYYHPIYKHNYMVSSYHISITSPFLAHIACRKTRPCGSAVWSRLGVPLWLFDQCDDSLQVLSLLRSAVCSYTPSLSPPSSTWPILCQPAPDGFTPFWNGREEALPCFGGEREDRKGSFKSRVWWKLDCTCCLRGTF